MPENHMMSEEFYQMNPHLKGKTREEVWAWSKEAWEQGQERMRSSLMKQQPMTYEEKVAQAQRLAKYRDEPVQNGPEQTAG